MLKSDCCTRTIQTAGVVPKSTQYGSSLPMTQKKLGHKVGLIDLSTIASKEWAFMYNIFSIQHLIRAASEQAKI